MLVNRHTGEWQGGRFVLSDFCAMNPNTTYAALKRLEKEKMITLSSNNKFTTISICNWFQYQSDDNTNRQQPDNNQITTGQQPDNTITRIKKEELRIKKDTTTQKDTDPKSNDYHELVEHVRTIQDLRPYPSKARQYKAAKDILTSGYTLKEAKWAAKAMKLDRFWGQKTFDVVKLANHIQEFQKKGYQLYLDEVNGGLTPEQVAAEEAAFQEAKKRYLRQQAAKEAFGL